MKKAISLGVAAAMAATLLAGCGTAASSALLLPARPQALQTAPLPSLLLLPKPLPARPTRSTPPIPLS